MRDPFHAGEHAIQELVGDRDVARIHGQAITAFIPAPAFPFITQQQAGVVGWGDANGRPWAAVIGGPAGFAQASRTGAELHLHLQDGDRLRRIPPFAGLQLADHLAVLFIDLATRRRLRVGGRIRHLAAEALSLAVDQACPLCPKYIQRRRPTRRESASGSASDISTGHELTAELIAWITTADTCFVASVDLAGCADVSHRGGNPGFIQCQDGVLRLPDYPGNKMYHTLGNFRVHPYAGLTVLDFATNRQLQMTGAVTLDIHPEQPDPASGGTGRWWHFRPEAWVMSPLNQTFDWAPAELSPFNP